MSSTKRRHRVDSLTAFALIALAIIVAGGCASTPNVPPAVRAELAPLGKLRVGLVLSNQLLVTKDPRTGELRGVTVNLGKALARRLGVPFEAVGYGTPAALVETFGADAWDIAFLAVDPARAQELDFSPPYMEIDNTYLVASKSKVATVDGADRAGVIIAVPQKSAPELFLSRNLKSAQLLRVPGGAEAAVQALSSGKADAYAENAHTLSLYADWLPDSLFVLEGGYSVIQHAVATRKKKTAASEYVKSFIEEAKADGTVAEAIRAAGLRRARVAPPSQMK